MFSKKIIKFSGEKDHLITKSHDSSLKKGIQIEVPMGYELLLVENDGTQELIKNQTLYTLKKPVYLLYYIKGNRKIIKSNWGTSTRIQTKTEKGLEKLGGFGHIEFKLLNPSRFIATRMENDTHVDEIMLKKIILDLIPSMFHSVLPSLEPLDTSSPSNLINRLKDEIAKPIAKSLDDMGISLNQFVIENINFETVQEA